MTKRKSVYDSFHREVKRRVIEIQHGEQDFDSYITLALSSRIDLADHRFDTAFEKTMTAVAYFELNKAVLLEMAITVHIRKKQYDEALAASKEIISIAPELALGYRLCGSILAYHGYHKRAIELYKEALKNMPDFDADYEVIKELKRQSHVKLERRVDFFASLPLEITQLIIDNLVLYTDVFVCLNVSRHWRQVLASHSLLWREMDISFDALDRFNMFRLIQIAGMNVRRLRVSGIGLDAFEEVVNAIVGGQLDNMQHLFIEDSDIDQYQLVHIFNGWGQVKYLTELKLHLSNRNQESLPIGKILNACPSLKSFNYRIDHGILEHHNVNDDDDDLQFQTANNLRTLILEADYIPSDVLIDTLQQCPRLQTLQIEQCNASVLRSVLAYCPELVNFGINGFIPRSARMATREDDVIGLRKLGIHQVVQMRPADIIEILESCQLTLETAILVLKDEDSTHRLRWARLEDIRAEQLKDLTYTALSEDTHRYVARMLQNCENLESVTLLDVINLPGTLFEESLLLLPNLHTFKLHNIQLVNAIGLNHFFQTHASRGNDSSLRKVSFVRCAGMTDDILESLSRVLTLEDLQITESPGLVTNFGLWRLAHTLASTNRLRHIRLEYMDRITDDVIQEFAKISVLRTMHLSYLPNITADTMEDIARERLNLETLAICFCAQIGRYTIMSINRRLALRRH